MEERVIGFASSPDFSGNAKALYEEMLKKNLNGIKLIWLVKNPNVKEKLCAKGIYTICDQDENFDEQFKKIQFLFITHDQYLDKKMLHQTYISLWHGIGPKKSGYSLEDERERNFATYYANKIDNLCVTSEFAEMLFMYLFRIPGEKILRCEQARNIHVKNSKGKENLNKLLKINLDDYKKVLMYCPTFRKGIGKEEGSFNKNNVLGLEEYEEEELNKFLENNNYLLILKLHPSEENSVNTDNIGKNILVLEDKKMLEEMITINEVLSGVDCMITDYSSIYIDYLSLERPVIFLNTDIEKYTKDRGIYFESEKFWYPGPEVKTINSFTTEIKSLIDNSEYYKQEREEFIKIINGTNTPNTDEFIENYILKLESKIKIPKIIHYFENGSLLEQEKKNIEEWKERLQGYEFKKWSITGEEIQDIIKKHDMKDLMKEDNVTTIKMEIIHKYGGVFVEPYIQIMRDLEPLLLEKELLVKDNFTSRLEDIIGASKRHQFIEKRIKEEWLSFENSDGIKIYDYKDLFVSDSEQWRIGKEDFKDIDKYFNNTKISLKHKFGRIIKYGLNVDPRKDKEEN